jgi:HD-like signal output (HDOD) protein
VANSSLLTAAPLLKSPAQMPDEATRVAEKVLSSAALPTPPAVAMRVVQATANPDCTVAALVELLQHDPSLCAAVLKAANSCVYALRNPVTALDRAVLLLGMRTVRALVLTLSLPAMRYSSVPDHEFRRHWQASVSGGIIARELCVRLKVPQPDEELVCGLLRDVGGLALRQVFPASSGSYRSGVGIRPFKAHLPFEREVYGVGHPEMSAELLRTWKLPESVCLPVRYHHEPDACPLTDPDLAARARRLALVESLVNIETVSQSPAELDATLKMAEQYDMSVADVIGFLQQVVPKVEAFTGLLSVDVGHCPNFAATLARGHEALTALAADGQV